MKIISSKDQNLFNEVKKVLNQGGLVVYPTETCYGIGVNALSDTAVEKLLQYKHRPEGKPISIAVCDQEMAEKYVTLNPVAKELYSKFLPGPVTVISKSKGKTSKGLESESGTLGIRIPNYTLAIELIKYYGKPITATSANSAAKKTPYSKEDLFENLTERQLNSIDLFIDAGKLPANKPSTVIDTTKSDMQILRAGSFLPAIKFYEKIVKSDTEMQKEGEKFILKLGTRNSKLEDDSKCIVILFNAELGAGKTQFTKGVAKGLGVKEIVKSPTYSLIREYDILKNGKEVQLVHFDAWRLENARELEVIGLEKYLKPGNVVSIEWAGGTINYLMKLKEHHDIDFFEIEIEYINQGHRKLRILK